MTIHFHTVILTNWFSHIRHTRATPWFRAGQSALAADEETTGRTGGPDIIAQPSRTETNRRPQFTDSDHPCWYLTVFQTFLKTQFTGNQFM